MTAALLEAPPIAAEPNKDNLRLWVADLRSGKFKQGKGGLRIRPTSDTVRHCCLGVACETAIANGVPLTIRNRAYDDAFVDDESGDEWSGSLPPVVSKWLGIESDNIVWGSSDANASPNNAIGANDSYNWSFEKIADKLEEHFGLVPDA